MSANRTVNRRIAKHDARCLPIIDEALEQGYPILHIPKLLEEHGIPAPQGGEVWSEKAVRRIIERRRSFWITPAGSNPNTPGNLTRAALRTLTRFLRWIAGPRR